MKTIASGADDKAPSPIDGRAGPIRSGEAEAPVLAFRGGAEHRKTEDPSLKALAYADGIIANLREPFLVLGGDLQVKMANRSFCDSFHTTKEETEGRFLYDLGAGQWNI